jgi:RHS repeat-associated protein
MLLDLAGRVLKTKQVASPQYLNIANAPAIITETKQIYDLAGRSLAMCQSSPLAPSGGTGSWEPINRNVFNDLGELTTKTLGCNLQTLDYAYTMRGWLNNINNPNSLVAEKDLFGMTLAYDNVGNITNQTYSNAKAKTLQGIPNIQARPVYNYGFAYDGLNRILSGTLNQNGSQVFALTGMSYDDNGNIKTLNRQYAPNQNIDQLVYNYGIINQLNTITDQAGLPSTATKGFFDAQNTAYTYDPNGNLKTDTGKGISNINYNFLNLPTTINISGKTLSYTYASNGQKLSANLGTGKKYDYIGGSVYKNDTLEFIGTAEGRITQDKKGRWIFEYSLRDHLQDTRITCACKPDSGFVSMQENHYDPFGVDLANLGINGNNRWRFINREDQEELNGVSDLTHRFYDRINGRFWQIEPKVEGQENWSVYQYSYDSPIRFSDADGLAGNDDGCCGRLWGGLKAVGGGLETAAGVAGGIATSWTGVGAVVGVGVAAHGLDTFQAGIRQMWTGETTESFTHQGIATGAQALGASESTANKIATGSELAIGFIGGGASTLIKASTKIEGVAQSTGTFGHAFISKAYAYKYALNPNVERVTLDLGFKKLLGGGTFKWGPRPDVGVLFKDGKVLINEVASKTDKISNLISRNRDFMNTNGITGSVSTTSSAVKLHNANQSFWNSLVVNSLFKF